MLSLGIDIGTSGIRSAVAGPDGTIVSRARAAHRPQRDERVDARLWWEAVCDCIRAQMEDMAARGLDAREIAKVAVDGTSGSVVMTDAALQPVTRALMYHSGGFADEAERIAKAAPGPHVASGPDSTLARAMRLASEDAEGRVAHLMHQADYIVARLTGRGGRSDVMNSLKTGVDPETGVWPDWVRDLLPGGVLPHAHVLGAALGPVRSEAARETDLAEGAQVVAGTTDSIAAFLAAAPLEAGVAVTSLGTTLAVKALCPSRVEDAERGLYSHRVGGVWLAGGASCTGGRVLRKYFSDDDIVRLSAGIDPNQDPGLDYYPLAEPGERFPERNPNLQPRLSPRPDDDARFLHGILDGIARIEARCYAVIGEAGGVRPRRILTSGGGASNTVYAAIRARHLGVAPELAGESEAAAGAARIPMIEGA